MSTTNHNRPPGTLLITDISSFQKDINWQQLKGSVDGVIIRAGFVDTFYGGNENKTDPKLKDNQRGARSIGLNIGYYYYAFGDEPPEEEARRFAISVGKPRKYELFWLDIEDRGTLFTKQWVLRFLECIELLTARPCHIYTDFSWAMQHEWIGQVRKPGRQIWLAYHWKLTNIDIHGTPAGKIIMHQYTSRGKLPGISTPVDLSTFYGTQKDWQALAALTK